MEGERINHSWYMVHNHGYGGWVAAGMEVVNGRHTGQSQEGLVACRVLQCHQCHHLALSHGHGGWVAAGMEVVNGRHTGQSQEGLVACRVLQCHHLALSKCEVMTLMTPDRTAFPVRSSGWRRAGSGRSSRVGLNTDATRRLRFDFHAAGWLHSMVLHGHL